MSDIFASLSDLSGFDTQNQFASGYAYDVVAIVDPDSGLQLFTSAEAMKANVGPLSKIMDHPLEDGSPVSDYKIILPITIDLVMLVNAASYDGTYQAITQAFQDSTFLTVRTNANTYEDMVIEGLPHDESPEMFGMLQIGLRLREIQLVTVQYQALGAQDVANANDQSTVNTGEQQPQSSNNSAAFDIAKYMFGN
jgi:hypothetical protein